MNYTLQIDGFNDINEVQEFINWYEGQGEQDAAIWFEERKNEGKIGTRFMPMNMRYGVKQASTVTLIRLDMVE